MSLGPGSVTSHFIGEVENELRVYLSALSNAVICFKSSFVIFGFDL